MKVKYFFTAILGVFIFSATSAHAEKLTCVTTMKPGVPKSRAARYVFVGNNSILKNSNDFRLDAQSPGIFRLTQPEGHITQDKIRLQGEVRLMPGGGSGPRLNCDLLAQNSAAACREITKSILNADHDRGAPVTGGGWGRPDASGARFKFQLKSMSKENAHANAILSIARAGAGSKKGLLLKCTVGN